MSEHGYYVAVTQVDVLSTINARNKRHTDAFCVHTYVDVPPSVWRKPKVLQFILAGEAEKIMHNDIRLENVFVAHSEDLSLAQLAMGDFSAAQRALSSVS